MLRAEPWHMTLREYLGARRVITEANFTSFEHGVLDRVARRIAEQDLTAMKEVAAQAPPEATGARFFIDRRENVLVAADLASMEIAGGVAMGTTFVKPPFRGRGIGSEMICLLDVYPVRFLSPSHYSLEGFNARKGAHRRHVERAASIGDPANGTRNHEYEFDASGRARLREPWSMLDQNDYAATMRRQIFGAVCSDFLSTAERETKSRAENSLPGKEAPDLFQAMTV